MTNNIKPFITRAALTLALAMLTAATGWAQTTESVNYIDADGNEQTVIATVLDGSEPSIYNGWYVVNSNISYTSSTLYMGNTNLILKDNCTITVSNNNDTPMTLNGNLTIYGQSGGTGKLEFNTTRMSAINGNAYTFTINGGIVESKSTYNWGRALTCGSLVFNGGKLKLESSTGILGKSGTSQTVTLNWRNATDRIYISSFQNISSVTVGGAGGKYFVDGSGNSYVGTYTSDISGLAGKELQPATAYTLSLTDGVTTTTEPLFTYSDVDYYAGTVTLGHADPAAGWLFSGYTVNGTAIDGNTFSIAADATVAATFAPDPAHFSQSGDTYTIKTATGWNVFCDLLADNTKGYFDGKTVQLGADITVSRMAGADYHDFTGTFDGGGHTLTFSHTATGNYCAPFRNVQGATAETPAVIRNLNVVSTVTAADFRHPAGLIALQSGYVSVTDCNVEAHISNTKGTANPSDLYPSALVSQSNGVLTVSGCTTTGQIATDGKYAAGLIGIVQNTATIENCRVSVTIQSTTSGDGTHGGLVASQPSNTSITITGCLFDGSLLGSATNKCGGFIGWRNYTATITNSLFAPTEVTVQNEGSATFARNTVDTYNCYYTTLLNDGTNHVPALADGTVSPAKWYNGKATRTIAAADDVTIDAIALTGTPTQYTVSGITAYSGGGLQLGQTLYYGSGDQLSLTLSNSATGAPQGYQYSAYTASAGTLSGSTLTMPDADVTISVNTAALASTGQPVAVPYVDADGTLHDGDNAAQAVALDGTETSLGAYRQEKWYFVGIDFSHTGKITCYGDVHIILCDGKTMTVDGNGSYALWSPFGNFYFYGQNGQTGTLNATGCIDAADNNAGTITINGGIINATGDYGISAYGLIINRGTVNATGNDGHGIWSGGNITLGWNKPTDRISITASSYYGTVQVASGKKLHNGTDYLDGTLGDPATAVNGKTLRPAATATYTTADGNADTADAILLDASDTSLPAGNYLATGTLNYTHGITLAGNVTLILADNCHMNVGTSGERISGCGIEPDDNFEIDELPTLTITSESLGEDMGHLSVYTTGNARECITTGTIDINGGNITADTDGRTASPFSAFGDLTINGGTVTATTAGTDAHALLAYGNFNYNGGNVTATAPNGNAICAYSGNYTFSWRTPADRITIGATGLYAPAKTATFTRLFTDATDNYYGATLTGTALNALKGVTLEAAETADFPVTLAPKGYGTYYDGHYDITLPAGTQARIVTARGGTDGTLDYETIADGDDGITLPKTVPAGTAVMLCHDGGGSVTLTVHDADIDDRDFTKASGNTPGLVSLLHGSDVATETTGGTLYYKLTYGSATGHESIFGWYWGAADGAAFESPAHKAWLALPATSLARSFIGLPDSDDNTTGITTTNYTNDTNSAGAWYTLDGRKLDGTPMKSGIYVNNGKMVIIK